MQEFLRALRESGELIVGAEPPAELEVELERALREHDTVFRDELAPDAPELAIDAAHWGAKKLYQSCQLLTMRDAPPAVAHDTLLDPYDGPRGPETEYSVDLTLAYLPSLFHLAERVAPDDPVLDAVRQLASEWPLSLRGDFRHRLPDSVVVLGESQPADALRRPRARDPRRGPV